MTKPGDPGHAAGAREEAAARVEHAAAGSVTDAALPRHPMTLRRRLLVIVAALLVAVSAVIGVASVAIFHSASVARLDADLGEAMSRAELGISDQPMGFPGDPSAAPGLILKADVRDPWHHEVLPTGHAVRVGFPPSVALMLRDE